MIAGWITAFLKALASLSAWLHDRQQQNAGRALQTADQARETQDEIQAAVKAGRDASDSLRLDPGGLRRDDGFKRPD